MSYKVWGPVGQPFAAAEFLQSIAPSMIDLRSPDSRIRRIAPSDRSVAPADWFDSLEGEKSFCVYETGTLRGPRL